MIKQKALQLKQSLVAVFLDVGVLGDPVDEVSRGPVGVDAEGDDREQGPDDPAPEEAHGVASKGDVSAAKGHLLDDVVDDELQADRVKEAEGEAGDEASSEEMEEEHDGAAFPGAGDVAAFDVDVLGDPLDELLGDPEGVDADGADGEEDPKEPLADELSAGAVEGEFPAVNGRVLENVANCRGDNPRGPDEEGDDDEERPKDAMSEQT